MNEENVSPGKNHKSTPPTTRKIRNPFDKVLIDKLHKPLCSPGMCKMYKKNNNSSFRWEIDQACTLIPADIVACNSQFEPSPDPVLEKIAEEATERFFSQEMVIPSPLESSKKVKSVLKTSTDASIKISFNENTVILRDISAQTVLTLPPELPPDVEKVLQPFFTYTQDQNISDNDSLRRKLFFEEHSDVEHYDSEQTDDEVHCEKRPLSGYEAHTPVLFSPDLSRDLVTKGMKRTFGTPINKRPTNSKLYRNKILDAVEFGEPFLSPIGFHTPRCIDQDSATSSSLASASISPVAKVLSSDEEKNNFTSPESEAMATCLDCIISASKNVEQGPCFCKTTPNKSVLKRSTSLKESPPRSRKGSISFTERRSLSTSSLLHRSRSVQKLDFSMDMSIDGSQHDHSQADSESSPNNDEPATWSIEKETSIQQVVKVKSYTDKSQDLQSSTKIHSDVNILDETPVKGKCKTSMRPHEISKIRASFITSPVHMSLDNSLDSDNLNMEDKKIDFNTVDLKFLTENITNFNYATNTTKVEEHNSPLKRIDSGFNDNTFYVNASSYYESAIKPSELTVTNISKTNNTSKGALKEISNVQWMRVDSGFKDENSADNTQFYHVDKSSVKNAYHSLEEKMQDKENVVAGDFGLLTQSSNRNEAMSISDIFTEDITFNCNFSSTPSKNKSRKCH